jgi:hypothetical protein
MEIGKRSGTIEKKRNRRRVEESKIIRVLNIQPLAVNSSLYSPSSSKCEKNKAYDEKMQFAHIIIQDTYKTKTFAIEF